MAGPGKSLSKVQQPTPVESVYADIELHSDERDKATAPDTIAVVGAQTCAGVIIFDPRTQTAYAGHFNEPGAYDLPVSGFQSMLTEVRTEVLAPRTLIAYTCGVGFPEGGMTAEMIEGRKLDRAVIIEGLRGLDIPANRIISVWNDGTASQDMAIDPNTGKVEIVNDKE